MRLTACSGCQRHVRVSEGACPFCGAEVDAASAPPVPVDLGRLGRAALFAFGATLGATAVGCDSAPAPAYGAPPIDAGQDAGGPAPAYGAPAIDAGLDAGGPAPAYGAAPIDGG